MLKYSMILPNHYYIADFSVCFSIPEDVVLCLLLEVVDTEDVAVHIQHKLVETFCWENDIDVVKVCMMNVYL